MVAALPSEVRRRGQSRSRMADVARLAGVSTATVSRALRQPDIVSAELRGRIGDAIERLSYRPNLMAGGPAAARRPAGGGIVSPLLHSFFSAALGAVGGALAPPGHHPMLGHSAPPVAAGGGRGAPL